MYLILVAITGVILCWFLQGQRSAIRRNGKRLPRPPGTLPFAGNGIWFLQPRHRLLEWFSEAERKTGFETYEISVPSLPPAILISDPANVEHVFKNNDIFVKGDFFKSRSWDLFGHGIINADGPLWRTQRRAGLRFFSQTQLEAFIDTLLPKYIASTFATLDSAIVNDTPCDLQAVFLELTTRLMGEMAYAMDIPSSLPFSQAFDYASGQVGERFQNPFWKMKERIFGAKMRSAVKEVKRFGDEIVAAAVQRRKKQGIEPNEDQEKPNTADRNQRQGHNHLIDSLLDHLSSPTIVADAAMNFLSAGRDTTAQSLTWTFYLLMRNRQCMRTVLSEAHDCVGRHTSTSSRADRAMPSKALPCFSTMISNPNLLAYTTAVFNESLRLYPPVPVELKECTSPTSFPDGTCLPKGAIVIWVPWAMNRSFKIWGHDAEHFRPERWLIGDNCVDENERRSHESGGARSEDLTRVLMRPAHEFPVFNGGARLCLGKRMAELLGVAVTAGILGAGYSFEEIESKEKISQNSLTLPMEGGLWVKVKKVMYCHL